MDALELSALLCSRLCHELVGPIGAISNGLEVLAEEDDAEMRDSAVALMTVSASEAIRRISASKRRSVRRELQHPPPTGRTSP